MLEIADIMRSLSTNRPVFHSERDFQLALAWKIHEIKPGCGIRLEVPFQIGKERQYMDIQFQGRNRDQEIAIELKYPKKKLRIEHTGERFDLRAAAARDVGCHGFIEDIQRLERLLETEKRFTTGFAIFLTNDPLYWEDRKGRTNYDDFHISEGEKVAGEMNGVKNGKSTSICLKNSYDIHWHNYSHVAKQEKYGRFRYIVVKVVLPSRT